MPSSVQNTKSRDPLAARAPGFLLLDARHRPIFYNAEAERILNFSINGHLQRPGKATIAEAVRSILSGTSAIMKTESEGEPEILSGRRHYSWQTFSLLEKNGKRSPRITAVLIEVRRDQRKQAGMPEVTREYRLTDREGETVTHLKLGLTSKEIAARMQVSPNTVKVFLRSVMSKMAVSTRSGILGKIMQNSSDSRLSL